jgi:hypothetical protein
VARPKAGKGRKRVAGKRSATKVTARSRSGKRLAPARQDWNTLEKNLAAVLGAMGEDQFLIVSAKREPWFVQFAAKGAGGLRAEAVSNNYLPEGSRLPDTKVAALKRLGWLPPTGLPPESTPEKQPNGSPNFFRDFTPPVPFEDVARLAVETLAKVHGVVHPTALEYQSFHEGHGALLLPTLGLTPLRQEPAGKSSRKSPAGEGHDFASLRALVLRTVRAGMKDDAVDYDGDGDLRVRFGSAVAFVRPMKDPLSVRVFSPVLAAVEADLELLARLNDLNADTSFARLLHQGNTVYASVDVPAAPLVPEHLDRAIAGLGGYADELDDHLQMDFGGRTAFGEFRPRPVERSLGFKPPKATA